MKRYVQFLATVSLAVEVDVPDDTPADDVGEMARQLADEKWSEVAPGSLCHQCSGEFGEIGDWEQDESESGVWAP